MFVTSSYILDEYIMKRKIEYYGDNVGKWKGVSCDLFCVGREGNIAVNNGENVNERRFMAFNVGTMKPISEMMNGFLFRQKKKRRFLKTIIENFSMKWEYYFTMFEKISVFIHAPVVKVFLHLFSTVLLVFGGQFFR